jgi:P-type E1-E2 ATPase
VVILRNGVEEEIQYNDIQVGDIIKIKGGMNIPVDGIILKCSGVLCSEAAMTGESEEMKKESFENCLIRKSEKEQENQFRQNPSAHSTHDLPSPILLSGT